MPRDRLTELQAASKHAPITEEEEMAPLNPKNNKKNSKEDNGQVRNSINTYEVPQKYLTNMLLLTESLNYKRKL